MYISISCIHTLSYKFSNKEPSGFDDLLDEMADNDYIKLDNIETRGPWALTLCLRTNLPLAKVPEVAHIPSVYPRGVQLS